MTASEIEETPWELSDPDRFLDQKANAFTVDVEEWFQVGAFENTLERADWPKLESRVELQTRGVLDLLKKLNIKATLFCLGWVAERYPHLIRDIAGQGHEVACHGMDHQRLFTMDRESFKKDVCESKRLLEEASGTEILGYRAPSFSLTRHVWWAYEVLEEAGFKYSSSLYPVETDHYGMAQAPRVPFYPLGQGMILEVPMTVCDIPFRRLPASGGGYFRLLPYILSKYLMAQGSSQTGTPGIFYMHPWEMDPGQPFVREAPLLSKFRHYTGQERLPKKITRWASDFSWAPMNEVYAPILSANKAE